MVSIKNIFGIILVVLTMNHPNAMAQQIIELSTGIEMARPNADLNTVLSKARQTYKKAARTIANAQALQRTSLATDTIQYLIYKASGLQTLNINNATSANSISQYFDAPGNVSISGVDFYAFKIDLTRGLTQNMNVSVYLAGIDSLPIGSPLVTTTVVVDTAFGGGNLDVLKKRAVFETPVMVSAPFTIVINNNSTNGVAMVSNNYNSADGNQEWLCGLNIVGSWLNSYDVNIGGIPFDADFLIEPHVSYNFTADFSMSPPSNSGNNTVEVSSNSATDSFIENQMYNVAGAVGQSQLSYTFNFGDDSEPVIGPVASHTYANNNSQNITLTDSIFGWKNTNVSEITKPWSSTLSVTQNLLQDDITVTPNPTKSQFKILNLVPQNNYKITIYDLTGKIVEQALNKVEFNTTHTILLGECQPKLLEFS